MKLKEFRVSSEIEAKNYVDYYNQIRNAMAVPEWLSSFDEDAFNGNMDIGGKVWVYYDGDEIACSVMYMPATQKFIDKINLELNADDIGECGPIMVSPNYRGLGLQAEMLAVLEDYCKSIGKTHILTTIHPENEISAKNFKKSGYAHYSTVNLKRGDRDLFLKQI